MILSTHVLDISRGAPAAGIAISLYALDNANRLLIAQAVTNADGRTQAPLHTDLAPRTYELVFALGLYFARFNVPTFYDEIPIRFKLDGPNSGRYHVPLLIAPWSYSTYRGS